ncbi:MAG: Ig-like domain-containing protein [Gemmatimonadetes bacterium]|nr:Ig-like domain-containing protein [Gemmatimonadota bacterium]
MTDSTLTVGALAKGTATITVTAADAGGLTAEQSFDVTVPIPNRAPAAVGTIPARTVQVGDAATLDLSASFSDPDGDTLTYTASSSDSSVATPAVTDSTLTVGAHAKGTATITVTAADADGLTATQSFDVTVPNQAPVVVGQLPARTVQVGDADTLDLSASFSDPDGDALTYTASSSDSSVATAGVTDSTLTVDGLAKGTATITVTAADADGFTATQSFDVTVPNQAPVAEGTISARTIEVGDADTLVVSGSFSDPDGDALTYTGRRDGFDADDRRAREGHGHDHGDGCRCRHHGRSDLPGDRAEPGACRGGDDLGADDRGRRCGGVLRFGQLQRSGR